VLKGSARVRAAALTQLARRPSRVLSPRGRRHLVAKLRR
jgi:hypothetical protein